jgi:hypothetical protein
MDLQLHKSHTSDLDQRHRLSHHPETLDLKRRTWDAFLPHRCGTNQSHSFLLAFHAVLPVLNQEAILVQALLSMATPFQQRLQIYILLRATPLQSHSLCGRTSSLINYSLTVPAFRCLSRPVAATLSIHSYSRCLPTLCRRHSLCMVASKCTTREMEVTMLCLGCIHRTWACLAWAWGGCTTNHNSGVWKVALLTLALAAVSRMRPGVIALGETRRVRLWRSMLRIGESGVFFCL